MLKLCREVRGAMGGVGTSAGSRCWIFGTRESGWLANAGRPARFAVSMAARRLQTPDAIRVGRGCMAPRVPSVIRSS